MTSTDLYASAAAESAAAALAPFSLNPATFVPTDQLTIAGCMGPRPQPPEIDELGRVFLDQVRVRLRNDEKEICRQLETTQALAYVRENRLVERTAAYALGLFSQELGFWIGAIGRFRSVRRLVASRVEIAWSLYREAISRFETGPSSITLSLCTKALRASDPARSARLASSIRLLAAQAYRREGDRLRARRSLDRLLDAVPESRRQIDLPAVRLVEAELLRDEGRQAIAAVACRDAAERIAKLEPKSAGGYGFTLASAYRRWAEALIDLGKVGEARRQVRDGFASLDRREIGERGRLSGLAAWIEIEEGDEESAWEQFAAGEEALRRARLPLPLAELLLQMAEIACVRSADLVRRGRMREGLFEARGLFRRMERGDSVRRCDLLLDTFRLNGSAKGKRIREPRMGNRPPRVPRVRRLSQLGFLTGDPRILASLEPLESLARTTIPVLILGESGTGKEVLARALHRAGGSRGPFVPVNCGALPTELQESELFGHVRGAFTGAIAEKVGLFEAADGGTLLLDEIGEMASRAQVKLLRVLELGEVRRIGETRSRQVSVRVLAATNADLKGQAKTGAFRCDLYHRLCGLKVDLPPLRDRLGDIPLLASHFVRLFTGGNGVDHSPVVSPEALDRLLQHSWPGNVREFRFTMEKAVALTRALSRDRVEADVIDYEPVSEEERLPTTGETEEDCLVSGGLEAYIANTERRLIVKALEENGWNRTRAARSLGGLSRTTLIGKMKRLGLFPGPGEGKRVRTDGEA